MGLLVRLVVAAAAALTLAAPAQAAYSSARIGVVYTSKGLGNVGALTVTLTQAPTDDATARIVTYVPPQLSAPLAPTSPTPLGKARATLLDPATGRLETTAGALRSVDPAPHRERAAACTGNSSLDGAFVIDTGPGGPELPVVYSRITESGRESTFAFAALSVCYPAPGPAPKIVSLSLIFGPSLFNASSPGAYRWRSLWTPYDPATGKPDAAATVETQALDFRPASLSLVTRPFDRRTRMLFVGGTLLEERRPAPGGSVQLLAGRTARGLRRLAVGRTNANGNYGGRVSLPAGTWYLRSRATVRARTRGGCAVRTLPGARCLRTTTAGYTLASGTVRVVVPAR